MDPPTAGPRPPGPPPPPGRGSRGSAPPPGPAVNGAAPAALAPARRQPGSEAQAGFRRLLALLTMAIAVASSVLLPIAGTVVATAMIVLLRAADRTHGGLTRRRSERG